ncbi:uncharacterized protein LOC135840241 isoform X2 [Planococcus citri]|uniref:uncharacterized protein LOC135840241 isoform X2 n=1 Tax=Planococcus citri TaxID=170843 RepID=UPI0031F89DF9
MIIRVLGHQAPREPLLFLLWMTLTSLTPDLCAMRISNNDRDPRPRKPTTNSKLHHELKPRISNMPMQTDFPYRYVFPANHPFSNFAQYLSAQHPTASSSNSHNTYEVYATPSTPQQYRSNQIPPEYNKFIYKPPYTQPYTSPNPAHVSPLPFHATPSPVILLVHAGQPSTGPYQTYVLIPTDNGNQPLHHNLPHPPPPPQPQPPSIHHHQQQGYNNLVPTIQYATSPPYSLPLRANIVPVAAATLPSPVITHTSQFLKPSGNPYQTQMVQRPVNIYQIPAGKYYPQKKNSIESKSSSVDNDKSESQSVTTSTERTAPEKLNIGALRTRS